MSHTRNNADPKDSAQRKAHADAFFDRADAIIELANSQLGSAAHAGQVAASLTYAAARFAASAASVGFVSGKDFAKEKDDIVAFYTQKYQQMLRENLDDYAKNFAVYTALPTKNR